MKNLKLLTGTAVLAGLLLTTGCVKNEEADGVKALRQAQASKLNAEATAITLTAEADAAYRNAEAAVEQAKVAIQEAIAEQEAASAEAARISNALASATNENEIAKLELELAQLELESELSQTETQSEIDLALIAAENDLEEAQKELAIALSDYASEIAADSALNKNLAGYLTKYSEAMEDLIGYREDVVQKNRDILEAQLLNDYYGDDANLIALEKERLQHELELMETWHARYVEVVNDPAAMEDELMTVAIEFDSLEQVVENIDLEIVEQESSVDAASEVVTVASDDYSDAIDYADDIEDFTSTEGFSRSIPEDELELITGEDQMGGMLFNSLIDYDLDLQAKSEEISDFQEGRGFLQNRLSALNDLYDAFQASIDAAQDTRDDALVAYNEAVHAYNEELMTAGGDDTDAAVVAAETTMNTALTAFNTADSDLTDVKTEVSGAAWEFGINDVNNADISWEENFYTWVADNDMDYQDLIEDLEDDIDIVAGDIADAQEELAEIQADRDIVVAYIAYMEDVLGANPATAIADLKQEYKDAKAAYMAEVEALNDLNDERDLADAASGYAEDYRDALMDDWETVVDMLEGIEDGIAAMNNTITRLDNEVVSWDDYVANVLQAELDELETLLGAAEQEAAHYQDLINQELGEE